MPQKIAIIRFSALGDVAMLLPILRILKIKYPHLKIDVYTKKPFAQIFDLIDVNAIGIDFKTSYKNILGLKKLASKIDYENYDAVLDLHVVLRTFILDIFCASKFYKMDKGRAEKKKMINLKHRPDKALPSMHKRYADVFESAGLPIDINTTLEPLHFKKLDKLPFDIQFDKPVIGIAPFSAHKSKEYPIELMLEVINILKQKNQIDILLFGGGKYETEKLKSLAANFDHVYSTAGIMSLSNQIKWMTRLKLLISMDSGNAHLAAAMNVSVVSVWGVTHPYLGFKPFNQPMQNQILPDARKYPKIPVSAFGKTKDQKYANAIESIEPKKIVEKVINLLAY
ncbi:MAG: glycosyltransferase family 9 protein [Psychroflexus sp.]|nr:glycosyltransferase family 9 protein [Psychroflexus sp.]